MPRVRKRKPSALASLLALLALALTAMIAAGSASAKPAASRPGKRPAVPKTVAPAPTGPDAIQRTVIPAEAYKKREGLGPHVNFKITPSKPGKKGYVLVEIYNFSQSYMNVVDFWLDLFSDFGDRVEVHLTADDLKPSWSALRWVKVPGDKAVPPITRVEVQNLKVFDQRGKILNMRYYTDLIKDPGQP